MSFGIKPGYAANFPEELLMSVLKGLEGSNEVPQSLLQQYNFAAEPQFKVYWSRSRSGIVEEGEDNFINIGSNYAERMRLSYEEALEMADLVKDWIDTAA